MFFSCKISNSFINFLEEKGEDLSFLYESSPIPLELLRDHSYWIAAPQLEILLHSILSQKWNYKSSDLVQEIGHSTPTLHSWGVLDSVLKMLSHPKDVFNQPDRFLSYFISPEPPVENLIKNENSISFDIPLVAEQYPIISKYLVSAFESLPKYSGHSLATVEWKHIHIKITWPDQGETLFEKEITPQISPKFLQNIIEDLQQNQKNLEEKNRELMQKNEELLVAQKELGKNCKNDLVAEKEIHQIQLQDIRMGDMSLQTDDNFQNEKIYQIGHNVARLHDYMVRAQQLITMLSSQVKMNPGIKEAMRRMDWDYVKSQYPLTIAETMEAVRKLQKR